MSEATVIVSADSVAHFPKGHPHLYPDVLWLIRLRWLAIAGVIIASAIAELLQVVTSWTPLFAVAGAMAVFNAFLWLRYRNNAERQTQESGGRWIFPQLIFDLVSLTLLLHFAGGAENPFVMFYAFHVAIGAVFLPRRTVWLIGLLAGVLHTGMVLGEYYGVVPHHILTYTQPLDLPPHLHRTPHDMHLMPEFIASYLVAYNLMLAGIIYLVQTVAEYQRAAEAMRLQSEHIAQSRERLARLGEISAGMAHTIRNPLHGVINAAEILRGILREKLPRNDATADEMMDLMKDGLGRIERVTSRLLALTRDSAPTMVPTDIGALVHEALRFVETRAQKAGIRFVVETGSLPPAMPLDPDRIFEALVNLLDNALGACREGDLIKVTARTSGVPANGVCIRVDDTGIGIPAADLAKVLDPFFTTKPVGEGSGLGLAIANRIVAEHGGELALESQVGNGTSVQMFIPGRPWEALSMKAAP